MAHAEFTLTGLEEMIADIDMEAKELDKKLRIALREGAKVAQRGMKNRAPKDTHNLEKNIHIGTAKIAADGRHSIEVGLMRTGIHKVDKDTFRYGNAQEYGYRGKPAQSYVRATMIEDNDAMFDAVFAKLKALGLIGME